MLNRDSLLDAMSGVREEDIEAAAWAMGYLPRAAGRRRNFLRPLLIAAALAALLTATAVAADLLGRAQRMAPMPPDPSGEVRQAEIRNGFRGTPTYQGSARWWAYMAQWQDVHGTEPENYRMDFVRGDLDKYLVCSLYRAYDEEQAEMLYDIAEQYDLKLCREQVYFGDDPEEFYSLTGAEPFLRDGKLTRLGGYVLEDGSFFCSYQARLESGWTQFDLFRCYTGSIYPFGGAGRLQDYEETEYITARGDRVFIDVFRPYGVEITYMDPTGETYITLRPQLNGRMEVLEQCRTLAEAVDFQALCRRDTRLVRQILDQPTGAEDNPEAVAAVRRFQESPAFLGAREFQQFYRENFYGACFTGTYGMEGYPDIDARLEAVAQKYGLTFAREKTRGLEGFPKATVFDNGAWHNTVARSYQALHYIPKDALYTMQGSFLEAEAFRRIWPYVTADGTELIICTQGPTHNGGYLFCETEDAYILVTLSGGSPQSIEKFAETIDWTSVLHRGG